MCVYVVFHVTLGHGPISRRVAFFVSVTPGLRVKPKHHGQEGNLGASNRATAIRLFPDCSQVVTAGYMTAFVGGHQLGTLAIAVDMLQFVVRISLPIGFLPCLRVVCP